MEPINPKTGMTHSASREFIRNHFEEFVNRKDVNIGNVNFAPNFIDHGADVQREHHLARPAQSSTSLELSSAFLIFMCTSKT
jgi:hypothetical protein